MRRIRSEAVSGRRGPIGLADERQNWQAITHNHPPQQPGSGKNAPPGADHPQQDRGDVILDRHGRAVLATRMAPAVVRLPPIRGSVSD